MKIWCRIRGLDGTVNPQVTGSSPGRGAKFTLMNQASRSNDLGAFFLASELSHIAWFEPDMFNLPTPLVRTAFWASVLGATVLCLLPTEHLPSLFNWWDKAQHALGFAALTGLGLLAYPAERWRLAAGLLLFGAFIELAQAASGWRQGDWRDLLADAVGILAVMIAQYVIRPQPTHSPPSA